MSGNNRGFTTTQGNANEGYDTSKQNGGFNTTQQQPPRPNVTPYTNHVSPRRGDSPPPVIVVTPHGMHQPPVNHNQGYSTTQTRSHHNNGGYNTNTSHSRPDDSCCGITFGRRR